MLDYIQNPDPLAISQHILQLVQKYKKLTIPDILTQCDAIGVPVTGTAKIVAENEPSLLVWDNLSDEFVDAMSLATGTGKVKLIAVHQDLYLKSGHMKYPADPGYEPKPGQTVWLPTALIWAQPRFKVSGFSLNVSSLLH